MQSAIGIGKAPGAGLEGGQPGGGSIEAIDRIRVLFQIEGVEPFFLEEKTFKRVGGLADIRVDVRVVAATNRDLEREVKAGKFREDLFYRLQVMPIALPSVRERRGDVALLANYFIELYKGLSNRAYRERRLLSTKRLWVSSLLAVLATCGHYGAYAWVVYQAVRGRVTVGELTFLTGAIAGTSGNIQIVFLMVRYLSHGCGSAARV